MMKAERYMKNAATTAMLIEAGLDMMRQNIRRRYANESDSTVESLLGAWMRREHEHEPLFCDIAGSVRSKQYTHE